MSSSICILSCFSLVATLCQSIPFTYTIQTGKSECLYEELGADEQLTMSIFVTNGAELRATGTLEGPVVPPGVLGNEWQSYVEKYNKGQRFAKTKGKKEPLLHHDHYGNVYLKEDIDFEHLADAMPEDDDFYFADDDRVPSDLESGAAKKVYRERQEGDPWQKTIKALEAGWYRGCVVGSWYQITAELELRKSSEFGLSETNFHVASHAERELHRQNKKLENKSGDADELDDARNQVKTLNRLVKGVRQKQIEERRQLEVQAARMEHSHSKMVLGSLFETVLFILVTGFQVYTIRKWFQGDPMLGI